MALIGSTDLIVCFGHFGSMFWTNLGPIYAKMAKYDCEKASFYNLQAKTCIKRIKLSEIVDFCLFYIYLTILHLFWTNFGSVLDYLWTNLGFNTKSMNSHMKNNALLFKWSVKMVLTDSVDLILYVWANFGPILAQFRHKMSKYDPVKQVSKIFMKKLYSEDETI